MKIATDLEQSKKLAGFLPIESADMYYHNTSIRGINYVDAHQLEAKPYNTTIGTSWFEAYKKHNPMFEVIPAWSLSALLKITGSNTMQTVSDGCFIVADLGEKAIMSKVCDEPVDACCDLIDTLHKRNLI